jgi:hypothetical protein
MFANLMVANSDRDGVFDREFFPGYCDPDSTHHFILYWNEEYRSTIWGLYSAGFVQRQRNTPVPQRSQSVAIRFTYPTISD